MKSRLSPVIVTVLLAAATVVACGAEDNRNLYGSLGGEGQECLGGGTCAYGLICVSNTCVRDGSTGGSGGYGGGADGYGGSDDGYGGVGGNSGAGLHDSGPAGSGGGIPTMLGCAVSVSRTNYHACAIDSDTRLWCWGDNYAGELGLGSKSGPMNCYYAGYSPPCNPAPSFVQSLGTGVAEVVTSQWYTCARKLDGSLWCWGSNNWGQLGIGSTSDTASPTQVSALGAEVAQVSIGYNTACAVKTDGTLWCWGGNDFGQFADGTTTDSSVPVQVSALGSEVRSVSTDGRVVCAVKTNGTLWCWGRNTHGGTGNGTFDGESLGGVEIAQMSPVQVVSLGNDVASVSAGTTTCALKTDGSLWCWGSNTYGGLGIGTLTGVPCGASGVCQTTPVQVISLGNDVASAADGCALKKNGTLWCWGENTCGTLGDGFTGWLACGESQFCSVSPTQATPLGAGVANASGQCAAKHDGTLWCWGWNDFGQVGDGTTKGTTCGYAVVRQTPVQVLQSCDGSGGAGGQAGTAGAAGSGEIDAGAETGLPDASAQSDSAGGSDSGADGPEGLEVFMATQPRAGALKADDTHVYWASMKSNGWIARKPKTSGQVEVLAFNQWSPLDLVVTPTSVYWTANGDQFGGEHSYVASAPKAGGTVAIIASNQPGATAIDASQSTLYWSNANDGTIVAYPFGGGQPLTVSTGEKWPVEIVIAAEHLYWVNRGTLVGLYIWESDGEIVRLPLAGGARETLASALHLPGSLAEHATGLFWRAGQDATIYSQAAGGTPTVAFAPAAEAVDFAVDDTYLYWGSLAGEILRKPIVGGAATVVVTGQKELTGIVVDSTHIYWSIGGTVSKSYLDGAIVRIPKP